MRKHVLLMAAAAALLGGSSAFAGFTVTTGTDPVNTPQGALPGAQVGDTFATSTPGTFTNYLADTPADPQLTGADLPFYRYTLNGAVSNVSGALSNVITYTGTYDIFYDLGLDGSKSGGDPDVSSGNFSITGTFDGTPIAALTGTLTQTAGPSNPAFRDLSEGGNPVLYTGTYTETNPGVSGTIQGALRQNAVVPEPASIGLLGLAGLTLVRRRKHS
jgi:PEP-CTERM motif-containing protein